MSKLFFLIPTIVAVTLVFAFMAFEIIRWAMRRKKAKAWLDRTSELSKKRPFSVAALANSTELFAEWIALPPPLGLYKTRYPGYFRSASQYWDVIGAVPNLILDNSKRATLESTFADELVAFESRIQGMTPNDTATEIDKIVELIPAKRSPSLYYGYGSNWSGGVPIVEEIGMATLRTVDGWLEESRQGNRESFLLAWSWTKEYFDRSSLFAKRYGIEYSFPDDWDELVVRYFKHADLHDFHNARIERTSGEVRLLAATAIKNRSLVQAQLVLAFCDKDKWRKEVGDVLTAELAKLVVALQTEQQLTFS